MINLLTDQMDQKLRELFAVSDDASNKQCDAVDEIRNFVREAIKAHGVVSVVKWLKAREPQPYDYGDVVWTTQLSERDQFFMRVFRTMPGRGGKDTLMRKLSDAYDHMNNKENRQ